MSAFASMQVLALLLLSDSSLVIRAICHSQNTILGSSVCYDVWPVTLLNSKEYLQVNQASNFGQYNTSIANPNSVGKEQLLLSPPLTHLILYSKSHDVLLGGQTRHSIDFTLCGHRRLHLRNLSVRKSSSTPRCFQIGYSCLPAISGVGSFDISG